MLQEIFKTLHIFVLLHLIVYGSGDGEKNLTSKEDYKRNSLKEKFKYTIQTNNVIVYQIKNNFPKLGSDYTKL